MLLANGQRAANGYQAMAQYDSNGDGKLTAADAHFKDIVVWVDANHDGKTEPGELKTLAQLGITSIDLHAVAGTATNNGNLLGLSSTYTTSDGATHAMADVWFAQGASTPTPTAPALSDVLAQPAPDLLASSSGAPTVQVHADLHAHAAMLHGLRSLNEEEAGRAAPLI
jgi:hypothetical protein